jgi:hypothetical protein
MQSQEAVPKTTVAVALVDIGILALPGGHVPFV